MCVVQGNRINYNQRGYQASFSEERSKDALKQSEEQLTLFDLVTVTIHFFLLPFKHFIYFFVLSVFKFLVICLNAVR